MTRPVLWKEKVKSILPWKAYWTLRRVWEESQALLSDKNLNSLAKIYKTDKYRHAYSPVYQQWLGHLRMKLRCGYW